MKNYDEKLKIWECAALGALCIALCAAVWAQARQSSISSSLLRLHVIAVSDSETEQRVKLKVRDEVLNCLRPCLQGVKDPEEAKQIILYNMEKIGNAAERAAGGRKVSLSFGRENYPSREYEGFCLPAGSYDSLRVVLGEGKGKNWWCIVFPPLCLDASQSGQVQSVMSREDYKIVSEEEGCRLKFRTVELWGEFLNYLQEQKKS